MLKVSKKYILAFPSEQTEQLSRFLVDRGTVEIVKQGTKRDGAQQLEQAQYQLASVKFALSFLKPFAAQRSFFDKIKQPKILVKKKALKNLQTRQKELIKLVERVEEIEKRIDTLKQKKKEQEQKLEQLKKFGNLEFAPRSTKNCFCLIGEMAQSRMDDFSVFCSHQGFYRRDLSLQEGKVYFLLIGLRSKKEEAMKGLKKFKAETISYDFEAAPSRKREKAGDILKEFNKEMQTLHQELATKSGSFEDLKIFHDFLTIKETKLKVRQGCLEGGFLSYIVFWALPEAVKQLPAKIKNRFSEPSQIQITELTPEQGEEPPVTLENKKGIAPFQFVTQIFGQPKADEIDPTPYLSLFFILFFGICITDAGYGLVLAAFTALALFFFKDFFKDTKLLKLLFYGGISTFIVGVLFGGFFGVSETTLNKIPVLGKLKIIDPLKNTVLFMGLTFGLGYLQIVFAEVVKIISAVRNKKRKNIFSGAAWIAFYMCLGLFLLSIKFSGLKQIAISATLISGLFLVCVEGWGQKIFLVPLVGLIQVLQGLIGGLSDVLSYSRLMALGLGTAVIALIVNQMAALFGSMIPYVGGVVAGLILVGGHIFNLGINALSGFIHSGRLQFVEFFPKFLEGGGRRFEPAKPEFKYIKVEN